MHPKPVRGAVRRLAIHQYRIDLLGIEKLEDGWDGPGSLAPSEDVKANAHALIDLGLVPDRADTEVTPNSNGTISFEWSGGKSHLEVGKTRFAMYTADHFINGTIQER